MRRNLARLNGDLVMFQTVSSDADFSTRVATMEERTYCLETHATFDSGDWVLWIWNRARALQRR